MRAARSRGTGPIRQVPEHPPMTSGDYWSTLVRHSPLGLLSDLDGTLIPFAPTPAEAGPTPELLALLGRLVELPNFKVAIVTGRVRDQLDAMFGAIPGL